MLHWRNVKLKLNRVNYFRKPWKQNLMFLIYNSLPTPISESKGLNMKSGPIFYVWVSS